MDRRDPYKLKHKMTVAELYKIAPDFDWNAYFSDSGVPKFEILNVAWPDFFKDVNAQVEFGFHCRLADLPALACGAFACAVSVVGIRQ